MWVDKCDLHAEEAAVWLLVDQLDALFREPAQLPLKVSHFIGDVMHSGATIGEKLANRGLLAERGKQLDTALANAHRGGFDALVGDRLSALDLGTEEPSIGVDGLVEVFDGNSEMVNPLRLHARRMLSVG